MITGWPIDPELDPEQWDDEDLEALARDIRRPAARRKARELVTLLRVRLELSERGPRRRRRIRARLDLLERVVDVVPSEQTASPKPVTIPPATPAPRPVRVPPATTAPKLPPKKVTGAGGRPVQTSALDARRATIAAAERALAARVGAYLAAGGAATQWPTVPPRQQDPEALAAEALTVARRVGTLRPPGPGGGRVA